MSQLPPPPADESARLAALKRYDILDTPAETEFDDFTALAAQICGTPIALVSLVDAHRQWFKSKVGIEAAETPRDIAFCSHGITADGLFEVPDATQDPRFQDNPMVTGDPNIRFYAGAQLTTPDGHNVGMLCVKDTVPRHLTPEQRQALALLGRQVVARLELRLANRRLAEQAGFQQTLLDNAASAIIAATPEGIITHFNPAAELMLGYAAEEMIAKLTPAVFHDLAEVAARAPGLSAELGREIEPGFEVFVAKARAGQTETREWTYVRKDGSRFPVLLSVSALRDAAGDISGFVGIARDLTQIKAAEDARRRHERILAFQAAIGSVLTSTHELRPLLQQCAEAMVPTFDAAFARIWTLNEAEQVLELQASAGQYTHLDGPHGRVPVGKFKIGLIAQERKPHLTNQVVGDPRVGDQDWAKREGMVAFAGYPLIADDCVVGVMALFARQPLSEDSLLAMSSVANGLALTIQNHQRQETLRRSEESLYVTIASIGDAILATDTKGRITRMNPVAEKLTGWPLAEALGRPIEDVFHIINEETREPSHIPVDKVLATGAVQSLTNHTIVIARDGTERPISDSAAPIRDKDGVLFGVVLIFRDVTEEKRERDLESARAMVLERLTSTASLGEVFDVLIRHIERIYPGHPASILLLDAASMLRNAASTGLPEFYNAAIEGLAIGPGVGSCGDAAANKQRSVAEDMETHPNWQPYLELTRRAGLRACWSQPMRGDDGQVLGTFAIYSGVPKSPSAEDIRLLEEVARLATLALQHRQAEEALRASEANLAITLRSIGDAVLATDAQRRITRLNPIAEKLTGWTEAEALGRPIEEVFRIISEETREPAIIPVDDVLATGEIHGLANHTALICRDGREISIADSAAPIRDGEGNIVGVVLVFRDETEARLSEKIERQRIEQIALFQSTLLGLRDHEGHDLPQFFRLATSLISDALKVARVSIWLFDDDAEAIVCQDMFNGISLEHESGLRLVKADFPRYFQAIGNHEAILADDAKTHPATSEFADVYLAPLGISSMLDVPIRVGERLRGVLCCEHVGLNRKWTLEESKFSLSAAGYMLLAIEQAAKLRAEEQLRESEERHRLLIHGSRDAMMTLHPPSWLYTSCNPATLELFRINDEADFCELGPWDLSPKIQPEGIPTSEKGPLIIEKAMREGTNFFEWTHQRSDGTSFPSTVVLSRIEHAGQTFLQATVRDFTLQKQAEAALQDYAVNLERLVDERTSALAESERFAHASLNALASHIAVLDETGRIIAVNEAWQAFASENGVSPEAVGVGVDYLADCDRAAAAGDRDAAAVAAVIRDLLAGRGEREAIHYPCHSPTEQRWFLCRITRFPGDGPVRIVVAHENITAIIQAQQQLKEERASLVQRVEERTAELQETNVQLARADHAKSEFLSRMSHELRTPMNAILGFGQLLQMDDLTEQQQENIERILNGGRHLLGLINEVLDIARIESGNMEFSLEPISTRSVLQETVALVRALAKQRNIVIMSDPDFETGPDRHLLADLQKIKQVLLNLLGNAIKYNHDAGKVTFNSAVMPRPLNGPAMVRISITDTGPGIPADKIERLFVPFDRLGAEQTRTEGTGLGLALARRIVDAMGGKMGVDSTPGEGSTFWFELPEAEPARLLNDIAAPLSPTTAENDVFRTVLYIEDNLSNLHLVEQLLRRHSSYRLISAMQGGMGFDMARTHLPDLILLDLHLPDIHGTEVLRRLQAEPLTKDIPVVILSADATPAQVARLMEAGVQNYLTKPIDVKKFLQVLEQNLRKENNS